MILAAMAIPWRHPRIEYCLQEQILCIDTMNFQGIPVYVGYLSKKAHLIDEY
jgi:hypothetical protein